MYNRKRKGAHEENSANKLDLIWNTKERHGDRPPQRSSFLQVLRFLEFQTMTKFTAVTAETTRDEITQNLVELTELPEATVNRFVAKFAVQENGCWKWKSTINKPYGKYTHVLPYGRFQYEGKMWVAHRWIYEQTNGVVPGNLVLDHFKVPSGDCIGAQCVNPDHLEPVTTRENILRGTGRGAQNARKTHCKNGHKYDRVDTRGFRICTKCSREYARNHKAGA